MHALASMLVTLGRVINAPRSQNRTNLLNNHGCSIRKSNKFASELATRHEHAHTGSSSIGRNGTYSTRRKSSLLFSLTAQVYLRSIRFDSLGY